MANHALPTLASLYTDFISNFKDRIDDVCKGFDPAFTTPTNIPADTIRWNSATSRHEKYKGTAWISLTSQYEIKVADSNKLNGQLASYYAVASDTTTAINAKVNITDIVNNLTSTDTTKPLSANQGKLLKGFIDSINTILTSNDTSLDQLQEIVNYIKQNKTVLDTLAISNIAGLVSALAGKLGVNDTAANADNLIIPTTGYKHIGAWGNANIVANGNILVNSAYIAEIANRITYNAAASGAAQLGVGEVGTYALMAYPTNNTTITAGTLIAGSSLRYTGYNPYSMQDSYIYGSGMGSAPTGTWKAMGHCAGRVDRYSATLFLRVA